MTVDVLRSLISHLDRNDHAGAQAQLKAALKADKELWTPLKPVFGTFGCPKTSSLLQACLERGGSVGSFAEAYLQEAPREVWKQDAALPIKGHAWVRDVFHTENGAYAALEINNKIEIYGLPSLEHRGTVKPEGEPLTVTFTSESSLRMMWRDGDVGEQNIGDKKAKRRIVVEPLEGTEFVSGVAADDVVAFVSCQIDDNDRGTCSIVTAEGSVVLEGVDRCGSAFSVGSTVYTTVFNAEGLGGLATINGAQVRLDWLPRFPSGGTAPPIAEHAHQVAVVGTERFLITRGDRGGSSRRWLRLPDLVEDERFGSNFSDVDCFASAVWSGAGDRVLDGVRSTPIDWGGSCWRVVATDDSVVSALVVDSKDKLWLKRFVRHT
jgi:hypothetical protein